MALSTHLRAGLIDEAGVVRNESALLDEVIDTSMGATVARSGDSRPTVQDVLDRKVRIGATEVSTAGDLDAIGESGKGTVSPAAAAVLYRPDGGHISD